MEPTDAALWPLATGPDRTRWAAQALELYLRLVRIIITRAATPPGQGGVGDGGGEPAGSGR